jgi:glutathione S-transferase
MYQNSAWGKHQGERAVTGMRYLDTVLSQRPYLAGDAFSMADITAYAGLSFADFAKIALPADLTHLKDWRSRIAARPSVAAA